MPMGLLIAQKTLRLEGLYACKIYRSRSTQRVAYSPLMLLWGGQCVDPAELLKIVGLLATGDDGLMAVPSPGCGVETSHAIGAGGVAGASAPLIDVQKLNFLSMDIHLDTQLV